MPPSKFEANPTLCLRVKRTSFSLFTLASSCLNAYFRASAIINFLAGPVGFPKYGHKFGITKNWKSIYTPKKREVSNA